VHEAILEYMAMVFNEKHEPSKSIQIDRFAVKLGNIKPIK
jgi:hypothetical protein